MNIKIILLNNKHDAVYLILIILLSILLILPFSHQGFFPTHDGEWAVVRLTDMYRELKEFQLPPRYSGNLNFGYGYPLFNFAYPFPYYLGFILKAVGFGFVDSIKILFAASVPLSGIGMYYLSKYIWNSRYSGFNSAILYMFLPYRLVDLYVRGSLGESLSFVYFPLIILSFYNIYNLKNIKISVLSLAFFIAFLIMTHNIMAVFFAPIIFFCLLLTFLSRKYKSLFFGLTGSITGVLMAAFFWIPALIEKQFVSLSINPIADRSLYFVNIIDLFKYSWGYGIPTDSDAFTYQIGLAHTIGLIFVLGIILYKIRKREQSTFIAVSIIFCLLFYIMMLFRQSHLIWEILPLFKDINYPWTMLAVIGFLMSLCIGYIINIPKTRMLGLILLVFSVISLLPFAHPSEYVNRGDDFYLTNDATTTSSNEFMPLWVKEKPVIRHSEKIEILSGEGEISGLFVSSKQIGFSAQIKKQAKIRVNTIYYPGWTANVDNKVNLIDYKNNKGLMEISIPPGLHMVTFTFGETRLRMIANVISILSLFIFLSYFLNSLRKSRETHIRN